MDGGTDRHAYRLRIVVRVSVAEYTISEYIKQNRQIGVIRNNILDSTSGHNTSKL